MNIQKHVMEFNLQIKTNNSSSPPMFEISNFKNFQDKIENSCTRRMQSYPKHKIPIEENKYLTRLAVALNSDSHFISFPNESIVNLGMAKNRNSTIVSKTTKKSRSS